LVVQSRNGSGKTLSYCLPLVANLVRDHAYHQGESERVPVKALVVTPTREIAIQVKDYIAFLLRRAPGVEWGSKSIVLGIGGLEIKE